MKNWMKRMALVLTLVLVLGAFSACGALEGLFGPKIAGEWEGNWDMAEIFNSSMAAGGDATMAEYLSVEELNIPVCFEFEDDGTYKMYVDEDGLKDSFEDLKSKMLIQMRAYFDDTLGATLAAAGMTLDDVLASQGLTLESMVDEALDVDALFDPDDLSESGTYKLENGKLYFDEDEYMLCEIDGDTMTLDLPEDSEMDGDLGEIMGMLLPMTLKRK